MKRKRIKLDKLQNNSLQEERNSTAPELTLPARILGIDAALRRTGYGLIEVHGSDDLRIIDCGVIQTSKKEPLSECLRRLYGGVQQLLKSANPATATLESGFFHRNVKTAMILGAARGVVIAAIAEQQVPIFEYAPRQIKQAICGHGNAGKGQIAWMVAHLLGLAVEKIDDDATDALASALCHVSLLTRHSGLFLPKPS